MAEAAQAFGSLVSLKRLIGITTGIALLLGVFRLLLQ